MHIELDSDTLFTAIKTVAHAVVNSPTTPILENVLLRATNEKLTVVANNLEMAIEYTIEKDIEIKEPGDITVSFRFLASYLNLLDPTRLKIKTDTGHTLNFTANKQKMRYKGLGADEFPMIPATRRDTKFRLGAEVIKRALSKTLFSCASGTIRPTLAGVYIQVYTDHITFASTDSFRLSEYRYNIDTGIDRKIAIILPARSANEIMKTLPDGVDVEIYFADNQILLVYEDVLLYSRLLNGHFPDYGNFFPKTTSINALTHRSKMIQALRQVSLIARENNFNVKMALDPSGIIRLNSGDTELGASETEIPAEIEGNDQVGLNATYFIDALQVIEGDDVRIGFETSLSPILLQGTSLDTSKEDFRHIIMPLKI
jgi:DNA polymerase-3 subunit beta